MNLALLVAVICIIVSVVLAVIDKGWRNPLLWVGWAFAALLMLGRLS